jgi:tetratricopeptide (TPR) repeat protein
MSGDRFSINMIPHPVHRLVALGLVGLLLFQTCGITACVNTRYSREEERQLTGDTVKLIMGQFAHHGEAFYEREIRTTTAELEKDPDNVEARNDRAVAYLKLKEFGKAETGFLAIEESHPGRYRTHANLGVLYKKMGRFPDAAEHVRRSLKIQPEGHLGLGDYYVRMIDWLSDRGNVRAKTDKQNPRKRKKVTPPATNFLGIAYSSGSASVATNGLISREYLETLIKADRSFADALVVLGDVLVHGGEDELAYRAYRRAQMLDHPAEKILRERLRVIHRVWQNEANEREGYVVLPPGQLERQLEKEAERAADWVRRYEMAEDEAVAAGKFVDIETVKQALAIGAGNDPAYVFTGVAKGSAVNPRQKGFGVAIGVILTVFFVGCSGLIWLGWFLWRRWRPRLSAAG